MNCVRLLSLVIAASFISNQIFAMSRCTSQIMRASGKTTKKFCAKPSARSSSALKKTALIVGGAALVGAGVKYLIDQREEELVKKTEFATYYFEDVCDLEGFINQAVSLGINPNDFVSEKGFTPLIVACKNRYDISIINKLIAFGNCKINAYDSNGYTALMYACEQDTLNVVQALVQIDDIDLNAQRFAHDDTALMVAIRRIIRRKFCEDQGKHALVVRYLLEQPEIDVNIQGFYKEKMSGGRFNERHWNAISLAIEAGANDIILLLLDHGVDMKYRCIMDALPKTSDTIKQICLQRREEQFIHSMSKLSLNPFKE